MGAELLVASAVVGGLAVLIAPPGGFGEGVVLSEQSLGFVAAVFVASVLAGAGLISVLRR